jgi:hypothetical protein
MQTHQHKHQIHTSRTWLIAAVVIAVVVLALPGTRAKAADSPKAGAMMIPAPMKDPVLMGWEGTWAGESKMGDQNAYTELVFAPTVGGQWMEGRMRLWTDKTKKTPIMDLAMFLRSGATTGTYKAYSVASDGNGSTAMITTANGVQTWVWNNDNDTKETATLTQVAPDHVIYAGTVTDKTGAKLMDINQDLTHRMPKATASATPKKTQK